MKRLKKCAWCKKYLPCPYKKGSRHFCTKEHKTQYYENDVPTLKKQIQIEFNRLVTENQPCSWCGKRFEKMDCSHILSRGSNDHLRFDILNVTAMCSRCHKWNWHDSPLEAMEWFKQKYPERYDYLMFARSQFKKWTAEELREIRKAIREKNFQALIRFKNEYLTKIRASCKVG